VGQLLVVFLPTHLWLKLENLSDTYKDWMNMWLPNLFRNWFTL